MCRDGRSLSCRRAGPVARVYSGGPVGFLFIRFLPRVLVHLVTDPCLPLRLSGSFAFPLGRLQAEQQLFAQRARVWPTTGRSSEN